MRIIGAYNITGTEAAPNLAEHIFTQEFVSPLADLHKVEIMFEMPPTEHEQVLQITIIDNQSNQTIRQANGVVKVGAINTFVEFEFEPITDSKQKKYELVIGPEVVGLDQTPITIDQPLQLKYTTDNYYQQGELYIDGEASQSDLVFRTFHQIDTSYPNFVWQSMMDKIQADSVFFSIWLVLVLGALLGIVSGLTSSFRNK